MTASFLRTKSASSIATTVDSMVTVSPRTVKFPSTVKSLPTIRLFLILVVPDEEPILIAVAAPNAFTVAAVAFAILKVLVDTVKSPPDILISPVTARY